MIGTSLTNQALDLEDLEKRSKVDVTLEKCFDISSNDVSYKPKINIYIRNVAMQKDEKEEFNWIII